jgi:hypothetical protein
MARLRNLDSGETRIAEPLHIFGRAPTSSSRLAAGYVSAQHASLRWTGGRWVLRDLGSRNGTYLNTDRLAIGEERHVRVGMKLAFGKANNETWELLDDAPPPPVMAVPVDGGEPALLAGELIAVPSENDPQVTIYRSNEAAWLIERADEVTTAITNQQTFTAGGRTWRFCYSDAICETVQATSQTDLEVRHLQLLFSVSRDEEHVALQMTCGGRTFDMGARSHNYLLLTLARRRITDTADGIAETSCGWLYQEDLARGLHIDPPQLHLDVYRLRQQFGSIGVADAASIIERRPRTRQLRIGTPHLSVVRL